MKPSEFTRRDFNRLTAAAFGGIVVGTTVGCSEANKPVATKAPEKSAETKTDPDPGSKKVDTVAVNDWLGEKHVCRGLNACKNQGASKQNDCAGQGTCA